MTDIKKAIATTVKTGKVLFGIKNTVKTAKTGKAKVIIVASNCPKKARENIEYYRKLSKIPIIVYKGKGVDLGMACGKPFAVSSVIVKEEGDSEILKLTGASNV
jgi:large subunit ribosomal protein L30e